MDFDFITFDLNVWIGSENKQRIYKPFFFLFETGFVKFDLQMSEY